MREANRKGASRMRYSRQRELILQQVQSRCDHPTADDIYTAVRDESPGLSLGTVYRNLNDLAQRGVILRVTVPGQADRFDRTTHPHGHLCCRGCGRVLDVPVEPQAIEQLWRQHTAAQVEGYALTLYGLCAECAAATA